MIASACTPEPRRWCQSFLAYWAGEHGGTGVVAALEQFEEDQAEAGGPGLEPTASRPAGGALLLDGLWRQLGLDIVITSAAQSGRSSAP